MKKDLTQDGDTNEYGLVIWLGTKSERVAKRRAKELVIFPMVPKKVKHESAIRRNKNQSRDRELGC